MRNDARLAALSLCLCLLALSRCTPQPAPQPCSGAECDGGPDDGGPDDGGPDDGGMGGEDGGAAATDGGLMAPVVERTCKPGAQWTAQTPAFAEATTGSGFLEIGAGSGGATGLSLTVVDVDNDRWADVYAFQPGFNDFAPGGTRLSWLLRNKGGLAFEDITEASQLTQRRYPADGGLLGRKTDIVAWADVDNDGDMDAFTGAQIFDGSEPEAQELSYNRGNGTFYLSDRTPSDGFHLAQRPWRPWGATFLDADRDGRIDLFIGTRDDSGWANAQMDRLYLQTPEGAFVDTTEAAGLKTVSRNRLADLNAGLSHAESWATLACDLNNDGNRELMVASYGRSPNLLWKGGLRNGQPAFTNRSVASGYAYDHRTDWTVDNSARCYCKHNRSAEDCATVPEPATNFSCKAESVTANGFFRWYHPTSRQPAYLGGNSGTTLCADFNGDGWMDLLTNEIVHWDVGEVSDPSEILYNTQDPDVRFERPGNEATGLLRPRTSASWDDGDMSSAVLDFDNDGRMDILIGSGSYRGTRTRLFHQRPDGKFAYVDPTVGVDHLSNIGVGVADFDRDGDLDLILGHSRGRCRTPGPDTCYEDTHLRLFENVIGNQNNWLQLRLVGGEGTNRAAIGARVTVTVEGSSRVQVLEVDGGHGRRGIQQDQVLHFGLGASCEALVTIRWPDRSLTQEQVKLTANHRYVVHQGKSVEVEP